MLRVKKLNWKPHNEVMGAFIRLCAVKLRPLGRGGCQKASYTILKPLNNFEVIL